MKFLYYNKTILDVILVLAQFDQYLEQCLILLISIMFRIRLCVAFDHIDLASTNINENAILVLP